MFNKNKNLRYYNKDIREYSDSTYTWQELNCFYRPFALSMGKERCNMFLLLVSLYITHTNVENGKMLFNRLHPALSYFNSELENILNTCIMAEEYLSEKDMYKKAEKALSEQYTIIVPYDLYVLPYSRNYMEQHHRHYIPVKGFDSAKGIFYILDNMQNNLGESTLYSDFMMQYHQMYLGAESFHRAYDMMCSSKPYFWKVKCMGEDNMEVKENVRKYLIRVLEGFVTGSIKPYYVEWDMMDRVEDGHMLDMVEQINQRNVYYGEFIKYLNDITCKDNNELIMTAEELKKNWNIIKIQIMRGHNLLNHKDTVQKLKKNIELEKQWHNDVLDILKVLTVHAAKAENEMDYLIINELNADVKESDNNWEIKLSSDMVYDTWALKDDACQILYPLDESVSVIETAFCKKSVTLGSAFHIGLILKSDSGEKILYGNSRNIHLVVFRPDKENYEMYQSDYGFEEKDIFKVEFDYENRKSNIIICTFYIKEKEQWEKVYSENIGFMPDYAGVFVKSWERCKCEVEAKVMIKRNNKQ